MVNVVGTTEMLDALVRHDALPGAGACSPPRARSTARAPGPTREGRLTYPGQRSDAMLEAGQWDFPGLTPTPVRVQPRSSRRRPASTARPSWPRRTSSPRGAWRWASTPVLFRLQNVYGPGQSLTNPYTGIVSLFAQMAKAGEVIPVYEDGQIIRDFVFIDDVASALVQGAAALAGQPSSRRTSVRARAPASCGSPSSSPTVYGAPAPQVTGQFRNGDVRAASCDIGAATGGPGWAPQVMVDEGVRRLCAWIDGVLAGQA